MKLKHLNPKTWFIAFADWYIQSYHSADYIHLSKIQDEIILRVNNALDRNNKNWNEKVEELKLKLEREYCIKENGWVAEIENMEREVKEAKELKKNTLELDFIVKSRAHEIVLVTAEIEQERKDFIKSAGATMGKVDLYIAKSKGLLIESDEEKKLREKI